MIPFLSRIRALFHDHQHIAPWNLQHDTSNTPNSHPRCRLRSSGKDWIPCTCLWTSLRMVLATWKRALHAYILYTCFELFHSFHRFISQILYDNGVGLVELSNIPAVQACFLSEQVDFNTVYHYSHLLQKSALFQLLLSHCQNPGSAPFCFACKTQEVYSL